MLPWRTAPTWWLCLAVVLVCSVALALGLVPGVRRAVGTGLRKEEVWARGTSDQGVRDSGGSQGRCPGGFSI